MRDADNKHCEPAYNYDFEWGARLDMPDLLQL
jgi:hypothetical protein